MNGPTHTVALIGNPNCGKTTLFNALTGAHQHIGNWPGVTVERKSGSYRHAGAAIEIVDLPGTYSLDGDGTTDALDEQIARAFIAGAEADVVVNVVDASSLARGLYLTTQLQNLGTPIVVALNMMDVADRQGLHIDPAKLSAALGCPVVPMVASRREGLLLLGKVLKDVLNEQLDSRQVTVPVIAQASDSVARYRAIDEIVATSVRSTPIRRSVTDVIDAIVLNRYLALPIFLAVMYLMFMFTINIGSAFIDFFDIAGSALFVDGPRGIYDALAFPGWLSTFLADGVGGGIQLVGTFIPIIGCLFLFLAFLEDSGYMGRVAFLLDRAMQQLGLPGKSFVPLIVGFGCNVPAIMATRTLDNRPDRILTTIMAPYMSCGARLTVYALFAAAFFPVNGQNVVFALYFIGIAIAVLSAFVVRKQLLRNEPSPFVLELPPYHLPTARGIVIHTWQRLKGFITRAGKAIVAVVIILNVVSSVGTDGSFGNQDKENSLLSEIGRTLTPLFHPMGIDEDNWPATVGIFTGIFAKEVVVGTLDALYTPAPSNREFDFMETLSRAVASVPANLGDLAGNVGDPLGLGLGELENTSQAALEQDVEISTIQAMRELFHGELGAFSYLLFVLLYMPCAATIGVIYKELGGFWATFSTTWSVVVAYGAAVLCYQLGNIAVQPQTSLAWSGAVLLFMFGAFTALIRLGRRHVARHEAGHGLIPVIQLDTD